MLTKLERCPACDSSFICEIQEIFLQRQGRTTAQFFCMDCKTFFHRSGYQEDEVQHRNDTDWLIAHPGDYSQPIGEIISLFPHAQTCYEAGCGAGALLSQLKAAGLSVAGVDPNAAAVAYAKAQYGVDAQVGYFETLPEKRDLILCIDVLEHLEKPATLFAAMADSITDGGAVIVRVPYIDRDRWRFLETASIERTIDPSDPFCDNSVHITHFSLEGLMGLAGRFALPHWKMISQQIIIFTAKAL